MTEELSSKQIGRYVDNLNEEGLKQLAIQLLMYPKSNGIIKNSILEFHKFYHFPLKGKGGKNNGATQ